MELKNWLAIRVGVGLGLSVLAMDNETDLVPVGRLSVQWVVRLGRLVALTCSPFVLGPSNIDFVYDWFEVSPLAVCCEYGQLGLSFRF